MSADVKTATIKAVVAKGRTVQGEGGKAFAAGETVSLPANEVQHLRGLGFLETPGAPVIPVGNGPTFKPADGPALQAA